MFVRSPEYIHMLLGEVWGTGNKAIAYFVLLKGQSPEAVSRMLFCE